MNILSVLNGNQIELILEKGQKKNKVMGMNSNKKSVSVNEDKIFARLPESIGSEEEGIARLLELEAEKAKLMEELSLTEIHELVAGEEDGFEADDLCSLLYDDAAPMEKAAFHQTLLQDKIYFKQKNHLFYAKSAEEVEAHLEQIRAKEAKEQARKQERAEAIGWLEKHLMAKDKTPVPESVASYLKPLQQFAIYGDDAPQHSKAIEMMNRIAEKTGFKTDGNQAYAAFRFLKEAGIFSDDENLQILKHRPAIDFKNKAIEEASKLTKNFIFTPEDRTDLRELYTFSIDDEDTTDIDDAVSIETNETGFKLYVHIADVAELVEPGSALEEAARQRTTSIYLPDLKIPMLPSELSDNMVSLLEKKDRYALTYSLELDEDFEMVGSDIFPSIINVDENLSYEAVDVVLEDESHEKHAYFKQLFKMSEAFQYERLNRNGGMEFAFPSAMAKIDEEGQISVKSFNPFSKSNSIVKELMILINGISAGFCSKNQIPAIFIAQDEPDADLSDIEDRVISDKGLFQQIVRYMKKAYFTSTARDHFALGLSAYTQATSPIRRLLDLVVQRQIKHFIKTGDFFYEEDELMEIKSSIEIFKPVVAEMENESNKYWLLKYLLKNHRNEDIQGTVFKPLPDGMLVEIKSTCNMAKIISKQELEPGTPVTVKLHTIIPRLGLALGNL